MDIKSREQASKRAEAKKPNGANIDMSTHIHNTHTTENKSVATILNNCGLVFGVGSLF